MEHVLRTLKTPEVEFFFSLAWMLWGHRNDRWLNNPFTEAQLLSQQLVSYVEEFMEAK